MHGEDKEIQTKPFESRKENWFSISLNQSESKTILTIETKQFQSFRDRFAVREQGVANKTIRYPMWYHDI